MRISELWRITTFRLTLLYGLVFALGVLALLGMVYGESAGYLTRRVDGILRTEADALVAAPPQELRGRIGEALALNGSQINIYALFAPDGHWLVGNMRALPPGLLGNGQPLEPPPSNNLPVRTRLIARRLTSGEELVVGRDVSQLREMRTIIFSALLWSGGTIILSGLACGVALSLGPLKRLQLMQAAAREIAAGNLKRRMPAGQKHDELDMFAGTVNFMMDEVERLMSEVKGATETIAHDLRTPLTRVLAQLHRIQFAQAYNAQDVAGIVNEIDAVLERFRAVLRISELEARERQAGFAHVDLAEIVQQAADLYQPLAEARGVTLIGQAEAGAQTDADAKLLFEAVSNLVDNAIKFSGAGGVVRIALRRRSGAPEILVEDNGPGIPAGDRSAVLQRFYRGERDRLIEGSGLGLSIVAAIVRLHRFDLTLEDAEPGVRAVIACRSIPAARPVRPDA